MVQFLESERASARGHKLHTITVLPDAGPPAAVLVWHHGVAEHVGRYRDVFFRLAEAGIATYAGDVVGHGRSEGARALVLSYQEAADELLALAAHARADMQTCHPGAAPAFFLAGHSLGGLVAALACLRDPRGWAGLMLCSPALGVKMGLKLRVQAAVAHAISACFPGARLVEAVDPFDMNPDRAVVEAGLSDPLITFGKLPVRTASEALKGMTHVRRHAAEIRLPLWVHHGAADKCTWPEASRAFVDAAGSADKTLMLIPGGYHEVLFTAGLAEALLEEMAFWVKEHAGPVPPMWANGASGSPLSAAAAAAGKGTAE